MNKLFTKIAALALGAAMVVGVGVATSEKTNVKEARAEEATITFNGLGDNMSTTSGDGTTTVSDGSTDYTFNYGGGKKTGNSSPYAVLLAKGTGGGTSFFANSDPMPGNIKSLQLFINAGASGSATYHCAFSTTECKSRYVTGSTAVNIKASNNHTYTCSVSGAKYFCIALGANYNGQPLKIIVTYEKSSGPTTYKVSYKENKPSGATGTVQGMPEDATGVTAGSYTLSTTKPTLTGYTCIGWNTNASASTAQTSITVSGNTDVFAIWTVTLDAITSIGGTVKGSISNAGTTNWDFSGVTVTGTRSGSAGLDVKEFVDLSSSTTIPSSLGNCTVSITATKKSGISGSATSYTNNSVSGKVEAPKLTYTATFSYLQMYKEGDVKTISYAVETAHAKQTTATCSGHDDLTIDWGSNNVMDQGGNSGTMQFRSSSSNPPYGYIYNTSELPGTITNITLNDVTQGSFNIYYGDSMHPTSGSTVGGKFFTIEVTTSGTGKMKSATVTFEVSDKEKITLSAQDLNLDVSDGASDPIITDGTSAISGCSLISGDVYIASITQNGKVQPVGYGTTTVSVTKDEDDTYIYLPTSFTVSVDDRSKQSSKMIFTSEAGSNPKSDDDVTWSVTCNRSENEYSEDYGANYGTNNNNVTSLVLTTDADENRIIKNVVVVAMSASGTTTISVTVGSTAFACTKSTTMSSAFTTYNFTGSLSGAITISISSTGSSKVGLKSVTVLYVGDEAIDFASTFLGAFTCNSSGTSKPSFNVKEGETLWSWSLLASAYNALEDKSAFAANIPGDEDGTTIERCLARYDYVVGKYFKTGVDTSFTDFMQRNPAPVGSGKIMLNPIGLSEGNPTAIIIIVSVIGVSALGGFFFLRKRKEI